MSVLNNRIIIVDNDAKAQALATLLDKDTVSKGVTDKSNLSFISGKFNSVPVSLIAVGLGSAAAEVAIHDICALISGMKLIIRIGTCAGIGNQSAIGNVNVPKDGSIMATKNIDYWAERYVQHAEEAADSSIGKMFDTGLDYVSKCSNLLLSLLITSQIQQRQMQSFPIICFITYKKKLESIILSLV